MIAGGSFAAGTSRSTPTSAVDLAPTVLTHLGVAFDGLDGRALQTG
jgi:arylsulfatase A-like enzyme